MADWLSEDGLLAPGDTIDRYTVQDVIGTGGTAVVYKVVHQTLGTEHALKVLSVTSPVIRDRMLTEGRVQASLRHLNVVAVTDVLDVEGAPGLLMEHIDGPSLERGIQQYRIGLEAAETLFLGVVAGVRQAHHHGLVHRDLKPANVLLAKTPDGFVPKVTDFGLAKVIAEAGASGASHTRAGVALGTPAYMAPEQIRDARKVDQRADIFALGCILYELVTKKRVFPGDDAIAIYNAVLDGEYLPPQEIVPDLPARVINAIDGALVQDREKRIPDCQTLLDVLAGKTTWEIPAPVENYRPPSTDEAKIPLPPMSFDDAPEIQIASRGPSGETPAPASARDAAPIEPRSIANDVAVSRLDSLGGDDVAVEPSYSLHDGAEDLGGITEELSPYGFGADAPIDDLDHPPAHPRPGSDDSLAARVPRALTPGPADDFDDTPTRSRSLPWLVGGGVAVFVMLLVVTGAVGLAWTLRSVSTSDAVPLPRPVVTAPAPAPGAAVPVRRIGQVDDHLDPTIRQNPRPPVVPAPETSPASMLPTAPSPAAAPVARPAPAAPAPAVTTRPAPAPAVAVRPTPAPVAAPTPAPAPAPAATPRPAPAASAVPVTVRLLSSPPTASVASGGSDRGRTPAKLELPPGSHSFTLTSGDQSRTVRIDVRADTPATWCYSFAADRLFEGRCP